MEDPATRSCPQLQNPPLPRKAPFPWDDCSKLLSVAGPHLANSAGKFDGRLPSTPYRRYPSDRCSGGVFDRRLTDVDGSSEELGVTLAVMRVFDLKVFTGVENNSYV